MAEDDNKLAKEVAEGEVQALRQATAMGNNKVQHRSSRRARSEPRLAIALIVERRGTSAKTARCLTNENSQSDRQPRYSSSRTVMASPLRRGLRLFRLGDLCEDVSWSRHVFACFERCATAH